MNQHRNQARKKGDRDGRPRRKQGQKKRGSGANKQSLLAPITDPKQVQQEVNAGVRTEFRPLERQLASERRQSRAQKRQVRRSWRQYRRATNQAAQQQARNYGRADEAINARLAAALPAASEAAQGIHEQAVDRAELAGGAAVDPAILERAAQATAARQALAAGAANVLTGQAANLQNHLRSSQRIGVGARNQMLADEDRRRRGVNEDIRELRREKGSYRNELRRKLRQDERDYSIQRQAVSLDRAELGKDYGYQDAMIRQAELGVERADTAGRWQHRTAREYGRNRDRATRREVQRAVALLSQGNWQDAVSNRRATLQWLLRQNIDPASARRALTQFIEQGRRKTPGAIPPTGNTSLPGIK